MATTCIQICETCDKRFNCEILRQINSIRPELKILKIDSVYLGEDEIKLEKEE